MPEDMGKCVGNDINVEYFEELQLVCFVFASVILRTSRCVKKAPDLILPVVCLSRKQKYSPEVQAAVTRDVGWFPIYYSI